MKKSSLFIVMALLLSCGIYAQNLSENSYRGFIDAAYSVGVGDYKFNRVEMSTSHGYQFNPYFFIGGGLGIHFMFPYYEAMGMEIALDERSNKVDIPVFANVHCNFTKWIVSPFMDFKGGAFVTNSGGMYINVSVGCRFAVNEKQAVNVSVGYSAEKLQFETFDSFISFDSMDYYRTPTLRTTECITLKAGFEF